MMIFWHLDGEKGTASWTFAGTECTFTVRQTLVEFYLMVKSLARFVEEVEKRLAEGETEKDAYAQAMELLNPKGEKGEQSP